MRLLLLVGMAASLGAQTYSPLNCVATAVPALVRLEGVAERVGDIVLNCAGGTPGGLVQGDIRVISFGGNITNKLNPDTGSLDAVLTVNTGGGEMSTGATPQVRANNQFDFAGMNFNLGAAGTAVFRITNVRVTPPGNPEQPFQLALATNGPSAIRVDNSPLVVGIATRGLLASYSSTFVCTISAVPSEPTFARLLAGGTRFASLRFTEGFSESFVRRAPLADHGTRLLMRFSGLPAGARLLVPEALAGSTAATPTAAGDLGLTPSGGRYVPNANQLLLTLVRNPDANGAGGAHAIALPGAATDLSAVTDLPVTNGTAVAVYEVLDSSPTARESVQVPVFLGLDQRPASGSVLATVAASFGPLSTSAIPSNNPVPRYQGFAPPPDCQAVGDCDAGIFPKLSVESEALVFNPLIGQFPQSRFVRVRNDGGGLLNWAASISYKTGTGWLSLDPAAGIGNATIRMDANAAGLAPGFYEATLTISAGPLAGAVSLPVRMEARTPGPSPLLPPEILSITHAAFYAGPLAPGTLATLFGNRLKGEKIEVTVGGVAARVFFANETQVNFEVPAGLPTSGSVTLFVTVDGRNSTAKTLALTTASPGIFPNAVLNQDYSVNAAANPAFAGDAVQIFLTGLPVAAGAVTVRIHDYTVTPLYAGAAPGFVGLQQVNAVVPETLQSLTSEVAVCVAGVCSPGRAITVRAR